MPEHTLLPIALQAYAAPIGLQLHRYATHDGAADNHAVETPRKAVLLLHGASANRHTFTVPDGGLAKWLAGHGFDPWLLDWRGSSLVVDEHKSLLHSAADAKAFNYNAAAREDIRAALTTMKKAGVTFPIAVLGHCMGSAVLAEAIAGGHVTPDDVDCVVLQTLGLFYETPVDGRMKSEERILERLRHLDVAALDPRVRTADGALNVGWDQSLESLYDNWPGGFFHNPQPDDGPEAIRKTAHMCNRLAFLYGMPYHHGNLEHAIHGNDKDAPLLPEQFGAIPLEMYMHVVRNVRQRRATLFEDPADPSIVDDHARRRFLDLPKVTLLTGALNRLWHRDSIDRMYEWLIRDSGPRPHIRKHVLRDYGHQDLLWGKRAARDVFPCLLPALRV